MRYHITYSVTPHLEGVEKADVPTDHGACTAIIVGSVVFREDGSVGFLFTSLDGRTAQPLPDAEMWKAWTLWAKRLSESPDLGEGKKGLCKLVFDAVCAAMQDRPIGFGEGDGL